jgi:hypothetical protein
LPGSEQTMPLGQALPAARAPVSSARQSFNSGLPSGPVLMIQPRASLQAISYSGLLLGRVESGAASITSHGACNSAATLAAALTTIGLPDSRGTSRAVGRLTELYSVMLYCWVP